MEREVGLFTILTLLLQQSMRLEMALKCGQIAVVPIERGLRRHHRFERAAGEANVERTVLADQRRACAKHRFRRWPVFDDVGAAAHSHIERPGMLKDANGLSE